MLRNSLRSCSWPVAVVALFWVFIQSGVAQEGIAEPGEYFPRGRGPAVEEIVLGPEVENPAVLLIVIDTMRPDFLGSYGQPAPTSPFLDSLAADGVVFTNHFSNSTWTKPSVASILTGMYPQRHNVLSITSRLSSRISTVAQVFKKAGYSTGAVVGNKFAGRRYSLHRGYDRYVDPSNHFAGPFPSAEEVLTLAARWIELDKDNPLFYTIFLVDPHDPYTPPAYYRQQFCPTCQQPEVHTPLREYHGRGPTRKQIDDMQALYAAEVRYMDDQLKLFFDNLEKMQIMDRLTVLVVGDHGEAFGEHGVFEHAFHCWDEVVRTPMFIRSPRITERGQYSGLSQHVDVAPTLLKLAGIERSEDLQGRSLVQNVDEASLRPGRTVVSQVQMYGVHRTIIRDERYKLVRHEPLDEMEFYQYYNDARIYPSIVLGAGKQELYDIQADPYERQDIYQKERGRVLYLERKLDHYLATGEVEDGLVPETPTDDVLQDLKSLGYMR